MHVPVVALSLEGDRRCSERAALVTKVGGGAHCSSVLCVVEVYKYVSVSQNTIVISTLHLWVQSFKISVSPTAQNILRCATDPHHLWLTELAGLESVSPGYCMCS